MTLKQNIMRFNIVIYYIWQCLTVVSIVLIFFFFAQYLFLTVVSIITNVEPRNYDFDSTLNAIYGAGMSCGTATLFAIFAKISEWVHSLFMPWSCKDNLPSFKEWNRTIFKRC